MTAPAPLRVALVSLGCPKNLVDSEAMLGRLASAGCTVCDRLHDADIAVINTCGFLASARDESHDVIAEAVELKRQGRLRRVVVVGCLAQRDGVSLLDDAPGVDAVLGVNDRDRIVEAVAGAHRRSWLSDAPTCYAPVGGDAGRFRLTPRHTAYLRIAEGCSRQCSFCTIPAIRGPFRSKSAELVLAEAAELIADGAKELNVIAQDTTAYGEDLADGTDLAGLLRPARRAGRLVDPPDVHVSAPVRR